MIKNVEALFMLLEGKGQIVISQEVFAFCS